MSVRIRDRSYALVGGTATHTTLSPQTSSMNWSDHCEDVVGNWDGENFLYIFHSTNGWWSVHGTSQPTGSRWTYNGYIRTASGPAHVGNTSLLPSDNAALATARARTNPNRVHVNLPVFFFELRDIPRMIMGFAKALAKKAPSRRIRDVGNVYLGYEFGLAPFYRDLCRMMDFTNSLNSRVNELSKIQQPRGLQRNWTVGDSSHIGPEDWAYASPLYSETNSFYYKLKTDRRKWVSTKWKATGDLHLTDDEDYRKLANRLVFGRDIDFYTLWEAMPWTWLVDWFGNVGTILEGNRNIVPVNMTGSCIMVSTTTYLTEVRRRGGPSTDISLSHKGFLRRSLQRWPQTIPPLPEFGLPFLNGKQLSILSALGAAKFGRR
jgi:hypothetical protein